MKTVSNVLYFSEQEESLGETTGMMCHANETLIFESTCWDDIFDVLVVLRVLPSTLVRDQLG
jgi:hypothetical protein